jgi:hypothetical protein
MDININNTNIQHLPKLTPGWMQLSSSPLEEHRLQRRERFQITSRRQVDGMSHPSRERSLYFEIKMLLTIKKTSPARA